MFSLLLLACAQAPAPPTTLDTLDFEAGGSMTGMGLVQGIKSSVSSSSGALESGETGWGGETGLDTGETGLTSSLCASADLDLTRSQIALSLGELIAYSPPVLDLRTNPNSVHTPARLLRYDSAGGCAVLTTFSDADSMEMATGFGSEGPAYGLFAPAGMMARLVDNGAGEIWVFLNSAGAFWRVDPSTGLARRDSTVGWVTGALGAPGGGAYVITAPVFDTSDAVIDGAALVQLAPPGVVTSSTALPFASASTGFATLDGSETRRVPMFLSNDLALDSGGSLYILDSELSELAIFSGGAFSSYSLGLPYPSALAWADGGLVIGSGMVFDSGSQAVVTLPALHTWDPVGGPALALELSEPGTGWITQGFGSITSGSQVVVKNHWLQIQPLGSDLVVADPGHRRVLLIK